MNTINEKINKMLESISEEEIIKCLDDTIERWNGAERYRVRNSVEDTFKTAVDAKVWDCLFNNDKITKLVEEAINARMNEIIDRQIESKVRDRINRIVDRDVNNQEVENCVKKQVKDILDGLEVITGDRLDELENIEKEFENN
jgi:hypothetical protein